MNRWQKIAWYNIAVIVIALTLSGMCVTILTMKFGIKIGLSGLGLLGILGLLGLSGFIFKKDKNQVEFDERDKIIFYKSIQITFGVFWPLFTAACMVPWFILGPNKLISSNVLPILLGVMGITLVIVQSIATLAQYGWKEKKDE